MVLKHNIYVQLVKKILLNVKSIFTSIQKLLQVKLTYCQNVTGATYDNVIGQCVTFLDTKTRHQKLIAFVK
jgi:hypothetical protein